MRKPFPVLIGAIALLSRTAFGDLTWGINGAGGSGTWDTSTLNWWNGSANVQWPNSGTAVFDGTAGTVTIGGSVTADKLTFNTSGYSIQSSSLNGTANGLTVETNADATINSTIYSAGSGTTTFTKTGSATLNFGGSISFFGQVAISAGELRATKFNATNSFTPYSLSNTAGVFLTLGGSGNISYSIAGLSGGGAAGGVVRPDNVTGIKTLSISSTGGTFAGSLQDNGAGILGLSVSGTSSQMLQTLTGVNTYSGATRVGAGTLALSGGGSSLSSAFTVWSNGTLLLDNASTSNADRISDTADFTLAGGTVRLVGNSGVSTGETIGPLATGTGSGTVIVSPDPAQSATLTFANLAARSASNRGTLLFQGANLGADVGAGVGTVLFNTAPSLVGGNGSAGSSTVSILPAAYGGTSQGTTFVTYGASGIRPLTDSEYVSNSLVSGATSNVSLNTTQELASSTTINSLRLQAGGAVSGAGSLNVTSGMILALPGAGSIGVSMLNFGLKEAVIFAQSDIVISSAINGNNGVLGLTKAGTGRLTLTSSNDYTGQTSVNAGVLNIRTSGALGSTTDSVDVNQATLELQGGLNIGEKPLTLYGGTLRSVAGANTWAGSVSATLPIVTVNSDSLTLTGPLNVSGTLTKDGNGTLTVAQPMNSGAGVSMNAGTFTSNATNGAPFGDRTLYLNGGTLALAPAGAGADVSLASGASVFSDAALLYSGSGTLLLNKGANNSLTLTIGATSAISTALGRSGKGTLIVAPANGINALGVSEKLKINGGAPTANGIASTSLAGQNNDSDKSGDFLTYNTSDGFKAATYSSSTNVNTAGSAAVFNAVTPQPLTGAATVYALKNSGQALSLGTNTLTIGDKISGHHFGLIMNGGSMSGGTLAFGSAEGTVYTSLAGGTISSAITATGGLTKFGPGTLTLSGSNTYTGGTAVFGGTLKVNGSIAGNVSQSNGSTLSGSGSVAGSVAGGLISPGVSSGILKAGSTARSYTLASSSNVVTFSTSYAFEFTQAGQPNYNSATNSGNDVLRLTSANAPFSSALTSSNEINVYFNISTGVQGGDVFFGGFYTDQNAPFDSFIQNAAYKFFVQDSLGATTVNGVNYSEYTANPILVGSVSQSADFGSGIVNGYVTEMQVVPEPSTCLCLMSASGLFFFTRRRSVVRRLRK